MTDKTTEAVDRPGRQVARPHRYVDPFSRFHSEMDRLMEDAFGHGRAMTWPRMTAPLIGGIEAGLMMPRIDVTEDDAAITVTAELPGLSEDDVEVTLNDDLLVIKGEKRQGESCDEDNVYVSERRFGSFQRTLKLPEGIEEEKIEAHVDKGVLTVVVPKAPTAAKPERRIPVGAA